MLSYIKIPILFVKSFALAVQNSFRRPWTIQYPKDRPKIPHGYRGREVVNHETCISCARCMLVCPVEAIDMYYPETKTIANTPDEISKLPSGAVGKRRPGVDLSRCIFCGYCEEICPTTPKSISLKEIYELAETEYAKLKHPSTDLDPQHVEHNQEVTLP